MNMKSGILALALLGVLLVTGCQVEEGDLARLKPGHKVSGFSLLNLYEDGAGKVMGARLISDRHGFLVDILGIQSVPQGFMWVKSIPTTDQGEAHACEHLLLGKGKQGRYVANLEEMTLGSSSAWTSQLSTVYHFYTMGGEEGFYQTLEARLNALLNPDFTDEEIRREVCHIGVAADPATGRLHLEEKGTVYTEMVSSFESPTYPMWGNIGDMIYGKDHPVANNSGGQPDSMRLMTPQDMWSFHGANYTPANMGMIASLPTDIQITDFLSRLGEILEVCWPRPDAREPVGIAACDLPPVTASAPAGEIRIVPYPSESVESPGRILLAMPHGEEQDNQSALLRELFLEAFTDGPGSNLYSALVDSETRTLDLGSVRVWFWVSDEPGQPVMIGINGVDARQIDEQRVGEVRDLLVARLQEVAGWDDDSEELLAFNGRVISRMESRRKFFLRNLNSPPMFGYRSGTAGVWQDLLAFLERDGEFRKSLVLADYFDRTSDLLSGEKNVWGELISDWGLLQNEFYGVGVFPSPELMIEAAEMKAIRLAAHVENFKRLHDLTDGQAAMAAYRGEFEQTTTELEAQTAGDRIPGFMADPPLTLDDQLIYDEFSVEGIPMVASTFDNISTATLGLAFNLRVLPERSLVTLPLLPALLQRAGVELDGELIDAASMQEQLDREVTSYTSYISSSEESGRQELVLRGAAGGRQEMAQLLKWMRASLFNPRLDRDNLPRLRDIVDQSLTRNRSRMQGAEENWVGEPAAAWRKQNDPLFLSVNSFLTERHHLHRLKWLLREPQSTLDGEELATFFRRLSREGSGLDHQGLTLLLDAPPVGGLPDSAVDLANEAVASLRACLPEIPAANLPADWVYLCEQIRGDLLTSPDETLQVMRETLALLLHTDITRLFLISSAADRQAALTGIGELVTALDDGISRPTEMISSGVLLQGLRSREQLQEDPVYVGLVNESTRNGVLLNRSRIAVPYEASEEAVLNSLAGRTFGGGGGHGLFMRTWAAGLAYSNGFGYRDASGRTSYYAERCPDVAQTMAFVTDVIRNGEVDEQLVTYAIGGAFGASRAAGPYEQRGEAMASDLVDGLGPDRVKAYREMILAQRNTEGLSARLQDRLEEVYGTVLIGLGPTSAETGGSYFLIGPDEQFVNLENYIAEVEEPRTVYRIYPRDFWIRR
jgi:Zn-dependent M16 (insulinase) family peptidase